MNAAANYAFANRQLMAHYARRAIAALFGEDAARRTRLVYDVCHNIAKHETHDVAGKPRRVRPPQGRHARLSAGPSRARDGPAERCAWRPCGGRTRRGFPATSWVSCFAMLWHTS